MIVTSWAKERDTLWWTEGANEPNVDCWPYKRYDNQSNNCVTPTIWSKEMTSANVLFAKSDWATCEDEHSMQRETQPLILQQAMGFLMLGSFYTTVCLFYQSVHVCVLVPNGTFQLHEVLILLTVILNEKQTGCQTRTKPSFSYREITVVWNLFVRYHSRLILKTRAWSMLQGSDSTQSIRY